MRYESLIPAMERALADFCAGKVVQPVRSILPVAEHHGFFGVMPAVYGDLMGAKLVTLYPRNAGTALPTHQGIIALLRATTGEPLAMMDGRLITEMRTAAVTAVAIKHLSKADAKVLAILGSGVQARAHFAALRCVREFEEVRVWSRNDINARTLAGEIGARAMSAEEAVRDADVVVTVTHASQPVLLGKWVKPGALVAAVGAVGAEQSRGGQRSHARRGGGGFARSGARGGGRNSDVGRQHLRRAGRNRRWHQAQAATERVVFKSLGLAVEDLAAARLVVDANLSA